MMTQRERDALEFAGFGRGLASAKRALERETPLAAGSIAVVARLIAAVGAPPPAPAPAAMRPAGLYYLLNADGYWTIAEWGGEGFAYWTLLGNLSVIADDDDLLAAVCDVIGGPVPPPSVPVARSDVLPLEGC